MPAPHPPACRRRAVELARERTVPIAQLAAELGISDSCLRGWMARADIDEGRREGLTTEERAELVRLRRENRQADNLGLVGAHRPIMTTRMRRTIGHRRRSPCGERVEKLRSATDHELAQLLFGCCNEFGVSWWCQSGPATCFCRVTLLVAR